MTSSKIDELINDEGSDRSLTIIFFWSRSLASQDIAVTAGHSLYFLAKILVLLPRATQ